jgi:2-methylfumaryl-CoA isomerase
LTTLGLLPEALQTGASRPPLGNEIFGTFGSDFALADGSRVMVVAITSRQWRQLLEVTGIGAAVSSLEPVLGADFSTEGDRYRHRDILTALLRPWFAARSSDEVAAALGPTHVLWSPFRRLVDTARELAADNASTVVSAREEDGLGRMLVTSGPLRLRGESAPAVPMAPELGQHTDEVTRRGEGTTS